MSSLMDFDGSNHGEKVSSQLTLPFHENFSSPRDDEFSLEGTFSLKGTNGSFPQDDLHPLENLNNNLNGISFSSSTNPIFSMQLPTCWDHLDNNNPTFGCYPNFGDFYETKPFGSHGANFYHGALIPFMDNMNQNGMREGVRVLGHSQIISPINMVNPNAQVSHKPFTYLEMGTSKCLPPDEGSSTTPKNDVITATKRLSKTTTMVKKGGRGRRKRTNVVKGQWTIEEDRLLIQLVERYGVRKWSQIAQLLNGRIGKQCRERWHNHLRPDIKKDMWSEEEDKILIKAHAEIGNKWAEIAKRLPGRTENSIKNHWNATKRRQFSRRKCRSKYPRQSSLLQDYIKSLSPETINAGCRKKPSLSTNPSPIENNVDSPNDDQNGSFNSNLNDQIGIIEYDFSEVPDFNFDAQMFKDSSIDSLLDGTPNEHNDNAINYDQVGKDSSETLNDTYNEFGTMVQSEVKKELDLVEMINQVNL